MKNIINSVVGAVVGGLIVFLLIYFYGSSSTVRYVSMTQVFDEYKLKDKYAGELAALEQKSNGKLASLQQELKKYSAGPKASPSVIEKLNQNILDAQQVLTEEYTKKKQEYEGQIWSEINAKVIAYGKEHNIDFILGAKGDGNIMYASDSKDISKEIIVYINQGK